MAGKTRSGPPDGRKQWSAPGRHAGRWFQASWHCARWPALPAAVAAGDELRFGLTPVFLTSDLELLDRLRSYLEQATGFPVRLVTRRTYQEITSLLLSGQLDAAWICGFPLRGEPRRAWRSSRFRSGRASPSIAPISSPARDREAASLDDLRGDVHAFSDPDSNSGWLVTATALAGKGQTPERFFGRTIFTYGHRNVVRAVASGLAMSGSVDGYVYEVLRETEPDLVAPTKVIHRSELLGFPPVACAAGAAEDRRIRNLQAALVAMADHPDGRAVLRHAAAGRVQGRGSQPLRHDRRRGRGRAGRGRMIALRLPMAVKIPLVVTVFMAAVAVFVSERVLTRFQEAQTKHLGDLAAIYLDGLASSLVDPVVREDVWEAFDIVDRARQTHAGLKLTETVVALADGRVLASSDPRAHPSLSALPPSFLTQRAQAPTIVVRDDDARAVARRDLSSGGTDRRLGACHFRHRAAPGRAPHRPAGPSSSPTRR